MHYKFLEEEGKMGSILLITLLCLKESIKLCGYTNMYIYCLTDIIVVGRYYNVIVCM